MSQTVSSYAVMVIDSKYRNKTTDKTSNFTYSINQTINRISSIKVDSLSIPFSFYVINSSNNVLTFNSGTQTVTISAGNYNGTTLASALQTAIGAAFAGETITVTYSTSTYKLTITKTNAFIVDASVSVAASTLSKYIGFSVSSASGTTAIGDTAVNISGPNYLVIESNFLTKGLSYKIMYANSIYQDALAIVPVNSSPGGIITQTQDFSLNYAYKLSIAPTDVIDIVIYDDSKNILDLNGLDISITLTAVIS